MHHETTNPTDVPEQSPTNAIQLITFRCGALLVGLDLTDVQEINRQANFTEVPEAPSQVRGVLNLRGEVITMIDLKVALQQTAVPPQATAHNVFVRSKGEVIGLITDGVSDILTAPVDDLDTSPANVRGADSSFFRSVYSTEDAELVLILDLEQVLSQCDPPSPVASRKK